MVGPNAELRCEVPDAGIGAGTIVVQVVLAERRTNRNGTRRREWLTKGRILVVRPDQASGTLYPWHPALAVREVPAEDCWRDADARECSTNRELGRAGDVGPRW